MTALVAHLVVDCTDAYALSSWWGSVLDYRADPDDPNEPGHEECLIASADGRRRLLFKQVPDVKQVKNRLHLDLRPAQGSRDEELERLLGLGATVVADLSRPDGGGWFLLADPEGNEFCLLRSA
ncbi:hypothetical protein EV189_0349 [Motilibacter rhizosphaerae]|uniref:Glyoxalase-like domain-containing protein n=1 Tax=Motilibacter rhizosphaerae TaxID=598652 RepID=A0A4Q7NV44_9ACTN|nr:VOC family protein [Motilibacter rhizosphaerae]RZS91116.1 hypothetical protein EV189_0349 [Motilibacter rhizosphaerae]